MPLSDIACGLDYQAVCDLVTAAARKAWQIRAQASNGLGRMAFADPHGQLATRHLPRFPRALRPSESSKDSDYRPLIHAIQAISSVRCLGAPGNSPSQPPPPPARPCPSPCSYGPSDSQPPEGSSAALSGVVKLITCLQSTAYGVTVGLGMAA